MLLQMRQIGLGELSVTRPGPLAVSRAAKLVVRRKCGTVSESDEKWGGQSWLPPGFYPALSGVLHTLKSRLLRGHPCPFPDRAGPAGPVPPLERRLQARLPAPQVPTQRPPYRDARRLDAQESWEAEP
jgi:hypothetical protein